MNPTDLSQSGGVSILVTNVKPELRDLVQAAAKAEDRSVASMVRRLLVQTYGSTETEQTQS